MSLPPVPFPQSRQSDAGSYAASYRDEIARAWQSLDEAAVGRAGEMLRGAIHARRTIFACGNGGSAAIANHLLCDFLKGVQTDTALLPRVTSLSAHLELITAIANDIEYAEIFAYQLRTLAGPGDVLMTISSSGNSENIVRALAWARNNQIASIALTGFDGGRSAGMADINLHVAASNYGIVEDVAQYLRQQAMPPDLVPLRRF
jgi:D-sedoheptulose 7-phosphate isomerase